MDEATDATQSRFVLGVRIDRTSYPDATHRVLGWAARGESRYVCVASVHTVMEAWDDPRFREVVNAADLVTPDGMPLVWMLRALGCPGQSRVCGTDLTTHLCQALAHHGLPAGFYGGAPETLKMMIRNLRHRFPTLRVAYAYSPPFRAVTAQEDEEVVQDIRRSEARVLFVGLGCPKQERWMADHRGRMPAVMIGVGAAFDFLAGRRRRAPKWLQLLGLEWAHRLAMEPARLWRRYFRHNPRFVVLALRQLLHHSFATPRRG